MKDLNQTNKEGDFSEKMLSGARISITESLQKEKQIVVDPVSLKESFTNKQGLFHTAKLPTIITTSAATDLHPPTLQPPKHKFLTLSLPNSFNLSPRLSNSNLSKKKQEGESLESQCQGSNLTLKDQHLLQDVVNLRKSKSCGERRSCAPSNDFDHWLTMLNELVEHDNKYPHVSISKTEGVKESPKSVKHKRATTPDDLFRCSALCLYLPGFGNKIKPYKARKEESVEAVMSRTVSLENFECGSWASAALHYESEGESTNSYFDLPLELMKCNSMNEVYSPRTANFASEKDLKGILKSGSSKANNARKSESSPRHVRFSPSSSSSSPSTPSSPAFCISPRLRKAREDFNAFLAAAQSA
ncbi:hypothetical protein RIF29_04051 [Crotalaria pallida]|uniref:Uncharacterized protein n=1 Tax=Crotalaria pallida TaxID=3830 RepID=A0AAN9J1M5_CROPI